jgi:GT2 family glycosyltransferase
VTGPLVSVVIVLYNSSAYLEPCIQAIAAQGYRPLEVVFIDNGSTDDSVHAARALCERSGLDGGVTLLGANKGFAAANNYGAARARGDTLLFLNPDTEAYPDMVEALVTALEEQRDIGVAGCKVYYPDRKTLQHAGGYVRHNGLTMHYGVNEQDEGQYDTARDVTYVTGCAIAAPKDLFVSTGMFDTGYFPAYFEETDFCLRLLRMGKRVAYVPEARVVHHESVTTGRFTERYYYLYHKNRLRFMLKNFSWDFLLGTALETEQLWLSIIEAHEQAVPYNKAWAVNLLQLRRTLAAKRKVLSAYGPLPEGITTGL